MLYEEIIDIAKRRGFFFQSNEIYNPIAGFYDYGPVGSLIKKRLQDLWFKFFIQKNDILFLETSIVTNPLVFKASGHLDSFTDPVTICPSCGKQFRADHLLEDKGISYSSIDDIKEKIEQINCPSCGSKLSGVEAMNLMLGTTVAGDQAYLRPETAQGIFVNFPRLFRMYGKLPLAVAQIGRSFRNEISPRKGLVRLREFTQMEIEYFFNPDFPPDDFKLSNYKMNFITKDSDEIKKLSSKDLYEKGIVPLKVFAYFLEQEWLFYKMIGIDESKMRFRELRDDERPHYSAGNVDLEVESSFGTVETIGNAYRTDFDLSSHQKISGKNFEVVDNGKRFVPHVFEASFGVDRLILILLDHNYRKEGKDWSYFSFKPVIAPYDIALYPLLKKDGLPEIAKELKKELINDFLVYYKESGSIGRRYAKADEIGIPFAITIDHQTKEDNTVTIRYRDSGEQERIPISSLKETIKRLSKDLA